MYTSECIDSSLVGSYITNHQVPAVALLINEISINKGSILSSSLSHSSQNETTHDRLIHPQAHRDSS
ncbi:hypothetical protein MCP1_4590001 [Candidatus Terasakiella magnetica]|nr:hypothetical protein MCP1_4590001 [Candidatus Terasakiella magnetica]